MFSHLILLEVDFMICDLKRLHKLSLMSKLVQVVITTIVNVKGKENMYGMTF